MSTPTPLQSKLKFLIQNYLSLIDNSVGVFVSTHAGDVLYSQIHQNGQFVEDLADIHIQNLVQMLQPIWAEIRLKYPAQKFGSMVFETEKYRLVNVAVLNYIVTFVLDSMAFLDDIFPYIYLTLEKILRLYENIEEVQLAMPQIGNLTGTYSLDQAIISGNRYQLKLILIGEVNVGKTSIVLRFTNKTFKNDYRPTIGLNLINHSFQYLGNEMNLNIWDIAAHKYFRKVRQAYYSGTNIAFLVFDLTDKATFEKLMDWKKEIDQFCKGQVVLYLIGNKSDLKANRQISFEQGLARAKELNCPYLETSALTGENVEDAFLLIATKLINGK